MNICMYACMYVLYAYIHVCMHLCVYACMYICMHVCIQVYTYVIFKLGFERYGGNCPSWAGIVRGKLSGESVRGGNCPGGNVRAPFYSACTLSIIHDQRRVTSKNLS